MNTISCLHAMPCSRDEYLRDREKWLVFAPCPPPLNYQFPHGNFISFMRERLNETDTETIMRKCSRSWPYPSTTTTTTRTTSNETMTPASVSSTSANISVASTKIVPVLPKLPTSNAGPIVGVLVAVGLILVVCVGLILFYLRRKGIVYIFPIKRDSKLYTQVSTLSGVPLISGGNELIDEIQNGKEIKFSSKSDNGTNNLSFSNDTYKVEYKVAEECILKSDDTGSISQREHSKILSNHFEMQGNIECKDTEYCPLEFDDTDSVSKRENSKILPNNCDVQANSVNEVEHVSIDNALPIEETEIAIEGISCDSLQDDMTILTKEETETSEDAGIVLPEANEGHAAEYVFQAKVNDEAEPKTADQN